MAITNIQRVNSLSKTVNYITREDKTESDLISSYNCSPETAKRSFENVLDEYNYLNGSERELKPRMIVQSFSPNEDITPEEAHKYGKEFADNYLKGEHQYILATHHDTKHIHNHLIFNDINQRTLQIFDSTRENTLYRMRNENDLVSEKYGLSVIEKTKQKHNYISHKEYMAKARGTSFKDKMENDIDSAIMNSNSFDEFLYNMEKNGYESKQGKHLAFKNDNGKKYLRTKSLGFNYLENSIKYRINNQDYVPFKPKIINREWIDKSEDKFQENKGLHRWATLQNINYLNEVNKVLSEEDITLEEFVDEKRAKENFDKNLENKLSKLDNKISKLDNMSDCYDVYKESHNMMKEFKKLETQSEKEQYKKDNYHDFKKFDIAKKNINQLKKGYLINNKKELQDKLSSLTEERNLIYDSVNLNKQQLNIQEKEKDRTKDKKQERKNNKDKDIEL